MLYKSLYIRRWKSCGIILEADYHTQQLRNEIDIRESLLVLKAMRIILWFPYKKFIMLEIHTKDKGVY